MKRPLERWMVVGFPYLDTTGGSVTSEADAAYNCVAHAVGVDDAWWWPEKHEGHEYWPEGERANTIVTFVEMFSGFGYEICEDDSQEEGFEKVAIYVGQDGRPTHTARQLVTGIWTSKLGWREDIEHNELAGLAGAATDYGTVAAIMKRPRGNRRTHPPT